MDNETNMQIIEGAVMRLGLRENERYPKHVPRLEQSASWTGLLYENEVRVQVRPAGEDAATIAIFSKNDRFQLGNETVQGYESADALADRIEEALAQADNPQRPVEGQDGPQAA
jgi:hypothetical protein